MHRAIVILGLASSVASLGCGPLVTLATEDESTGDDASHDTASGSGARSEVDDGRDDTGGDPGGGSSGGGDVTGGEATGDPGECWIVQDLFKAPDDVDVFAADQDGDGAQEIWVAPSSDFGPGPGFTSLVRVDDTGMPGPEVQLDGFLVAMPDIDGDGVLDLWLVQFGMRTPPTFAWARGHADGTFELPAIPSDLELGGNVSGFFDADGDDVADAFALTDAGSLELLLGDGLGSFSLASELPLGIEGFGFVGPIDHAVGMGLLQTQTDFGGPGGGGDSCFVREYRLVRSDAGMLGLMSTSAPGSGLGPLVRTFAYADGLVATYTRACGESGEYLPELRHLVATRSDEVMLEAASITDIAWAAPADLDGNGVLDIALAQPGADSIAWAPGLDQITLGEIEPLPISNPEVRANNVRAVDLDGDGREEILRGWVLDDGEPAGLSYDRIRLGPCE
jgi:hypothetical protein